MGALAICLLVVPGTPKAHNDAGEHETLPAYQGEGSFYLGFRWVDLDGSSRAAKYEDDDSSLVFGVDGMAFPLPHRYHLFGEYLSQDNYYVDAGYAYRDLVLFRNILVGVHHNLDHYNYLYTGQPPEIIYDDRNPGDEYSVDFVKNDLFLRLKTPDFPLHTFFRHHYVNREGSIEERFLEGGFGNLVLTSESRDIDWESQGLSLGANSHLGPVEVEYEYFRTDFDPGAGWVLYDPYPASFGRPADTYPHNAYPETESYANSLRLHTSFTGQVTAAATLSNSEDSNTTSGTESETWRGAFDLRWLPDPVIGLFFKYRHRERDNDNPGQMTLTGFVNRITYPVRQPVSTRSDLFSFSTRYRPLARVNLIGNYDFEHRERSDLDDWQTLEEDTDIHRLGLVAHARPLDTLKLQAAYDYNHYVDPSYNTEPDNINKLRLSATYTPTTWLTALFDYCLSLTSRDDLLYKNSEPPLLLEGGERDGQTDRILGSLSFVLSEKASLTASWVYNRWEIEQDLAYALWNTTGTGGTLPYYDRGVSYTDSANTFGLSFYYQLRKDLSLTTDLVYTIAEGEYLPGYGVQGDPSVLSSFSYLETTETMLTVELAKRIMEDWEVGLRFEADFFDDRSSLSGSDQQDGELYITTISLKRYF